MIFFRGSILKETTRAENFAKYGSDRNSRSPGSGLDFGAFSKSQKFKSGEFFFLAFFHRVREDPQAYRLGEKIITSMHKIVRFIEAFYTRNFVIFSTCWSRYIKLSQLQTLGSFIAVRLETTL